MERRLTVQEVADGSRRHFQTVLVALRNGELHGTQKKKRAHWSIKESCAEAWADGDKCIHQQKVTELRRRP